MRTAHSAGMAMIATGVLPRDPEIPGQDGPNVVNYIDVLRGEATQVAELIRNGARVMVCGGRDMAAGVVIVREAGGFVQAIAKDGNMLEDGEVICANERIFDAFSDTIRNG